MPHLELAQHPIHDDQTYNDYIGSKALQKKGVKKWSRRVRKAIKILASLLHYDRLYLGGGNGTKVISPPGDVRVASNQTGITGGIRLWDADVERLFLHENWDGRVSRPRPRSMVEIGSGALHCDRLNRSFIPAKIGVNFRDNVSAVLGTKQTMNRTH
jgi:hypothetical protein